MFYQTLLSELSDLRKENAALSRENGALSRENVTFKDQINALKTENQQLKAHMAHAGLSAKTPIPVPLASTSSATSFTNSSLSQAQPPPSVVSKAARASSVPPKSRNVSNPFISSSTNNSAQASLGSAAPSADTETQIPQPVVPPVSNSISNAAVAKPRLTPAQLAQQQAQQSAAASRLSQPKPIAKPQHHHATASNTNKPATMKKDVWAARRRTLNATTGGIHSDLGPGWSSGGPISPRANCAVSGCGAETRGWTCLLRWTFAFSCCCRK